MRTSAALLLVLLAAAAFCFGQQKVSHKISRQKAAKIALSQVKHGRIESAELETEQGQLVWSFDVKSGANLVEVWVDAQTGQVLKTERETSESGTGEQGLERAEKIALRKIPGEVAKTDSGMHRGTKVYTFHIKTREGETVEVDVTPAGKIVDIETLEDDDKDEGEE